MHIRSSSWRHWPRPHWRPFFKKECDWVFRQWCYPRCSNKRAGVAKNHLFSINERFGIMVHFASDICNGILPRHCYSPFNGHSWHLIQYFLLWSVQSLYFAKQYNFSVVDAVLLQLNHSKNKAKPMILSTTPWKKDEWKSPVRGQKKPKLSQCWSCKIEAHRKAWKSHEWRWDDITCILPTGLVSTSTLARFIFSLLYSHFLSETFLLIPYTQELCQYDEWSPVPRRPQTIQAA